MNRWLGWALRLRARHSRMAARGWLDAMVLLRVQAAPGLPRAAQLRSSLHLHNHVTIAARVGMIIQPAARPASTPHKTPVDGSARLASPAHTQVAAGTARSDERPVVRFAPRTVAGPGVRPVDEVRIVAQPQARPLRLATGGMVTSALAAHGAATALRLRRNAVREESRPAAPAVVLAAPREVAMQLANSAAERAATAAQQRLAQEQGRAARAEAPINVEAITGLVVEQIDRRLLAYRERMGRA